MLAMTEQLTVTKANAKAVARELQARVRDGRMDPLKLWERLAFITEVATHFADDTTDELIRSHVADRSAGTGKVITDGGTYATRNVGTKYDYSGDEVWSDLKKQETLLADYRKARETFLKVLTGKVTEAYTGPNDTQARQITVNPPTSTSKEGWVFTMNKGQEEASTVAPVAIPAT